MQRVRPTLLGTVASYSLVGLGFVSIDFLTSWIDLLYSKKKPEQQKLLEEYDIQQPLNTNYFRNFSYGFLAANFNQMFHLKLNTFLSSKKFPFQTKIIISPFAAIPYYFLSGILERRSSEETIMRLLDDLKILIPIRLVIDYFRLSDSILKSVNSSKSQIIQSKGLFVFFVACKFINSTVLISVHDKKIFF